MKKTLFALSLIALSTAQAFAAPAEKQDACDRAALQAARKWARQNKLNDRGTFDIVSYGNDSEGNTTIEIQHPLAGSDGDCWTNIVITVQEAADDSCQAVKAEEDQSAESCS